MAHQPVELSDSQKLNPAQLKEKLGKGKMLVVDVRNDSERQEHGAIDPSINIPLSNLEKELSLSSDDFKKKYGVDKPIANDDRGVVFHCQRGARGSKAVKLAETLGIKSQNLDGGYSQW